MESSSYHATRNRCASSPTSSFRKLIIRGYKSRGLAEPHKSQQVLNERVEELAKKKGISMAQLALAWSLANDFITAPIIGTTNLDSLKELIGMSTDHDGC
jgi:aryl-alcohol dehydrogenase-like predicted oxidoreductase